MGQVSKGFKHDPDAYDFDTAGVLSFPLASSAGAAAITTPQQAISLPCSCKILGVSAYASGTSTITAFDVRYDSAAAFTAVPAASSTQVNGESDLGGFQTYPPVNGTVLVQVPGQVPLSVTYQPLAVSGNSLSNLIAGYTGTFTSNTQTFATAIPDMIYQKGHTLILSIVAPGATVGLFSVSLFYKPYHLRPGDKPLGVAGDLILSYADVL